MITVRPAIPLDAPSIARLLNEIIEIGGTTALVTSVTAQDMEDSMAYKTSQSAWHVALNAGEQVVGFQWIQPSDQLPPEAAEIATFVQVGQTGLGIGSKLFNATAKAAKVLRYVWIRANIRSDNDGGLTYYQSRGFRDYGVIEDYKLADGTLVNKTLKRYDV